MAGSRGVAVGRASLADMDDADREALGDELDRRRLRRGEVLLREGDAGDDLFVVAEGELGVVLEGDDETSPSVRLHPGDVVGEITALAGGRRAATVVATAPSTVEVLSGRGLDLLLARRPDIGVDLAATARDRLRQLELTAALAAVFGSLDPDQQTTLRDTLEWVEVDAGDVLFEQGDPADSAWLVVRGRFAVERQRSDRRDVEGLVGRGELVGERAILVLGGRRDATLRATRHSEVVRLDRDVLDDLVARHPEAMLAVATTFATRASVSPWLRRPPPGAVIAVVPASSEVDADGLGVALSRHLERFGRVAVMNEAGVDLTLERDGIAGVAPDEPGGVRLHQWLRSLEAAHDHVLYVADEHASPWTRRVLGRADLVVVVADAAADPTPGPTEQVLAELGARGTGPSSLLVLLQDETTVVPHGTRTWLDQRSSERVLHARYGSAADVERLARHVAGRPVCVVLSGGAARGLAHVGALRELEDAGVPVDLLAGASIGSTVATAWSLLRDYDEAVRAATTAFAGVVDYTLPVTAMAAGRHAAANVRGVFGDLDLTDLWLPTMVVSTDLTASRSVYHDRGPVVRAVRASTSIPAVFPPVAIDGHQHVDGGVLDNLPVREVRRRHPGATIVAVDVAPPRGPSAHGDWGLGVSGWGLLARRMTPGLRAPRVPGIASTILSSTLVAATEARDQAIADGVADGYLHLGVRSVGLLEFDKVAQVAEEGRAAAAPLIASWLAEHGVTW